ncbi:MAG: methyl-accepting chemotaxis protein [Cyanobacteria bacterium J06643_4]
MTMSLFGKSPNFKIQRQLLLLLFLCTLLPVAIVGLYGVTTFSRVTSRALLDDFEEEAVSQSGVIETFFDNVKVDAKALANSYLMQGFLAAGVNGNVDGLSADDWKRQLTGEFFVLLDAHSEYHALSYVDETGQEVLRVLREDEDSPVTVVSQPLLVDIRESREASFIEGVLQLAPGQVYVSKALEIHEGEVFDPDEAFTHYATPVFDGAGQRRGAVIVDIPAEEFEELAEAFEQTEVDDGADEVHFLLDARGAYLQVPEEEGADAGAEDAEREDTEAGEAAGNDAGEAGEGENAAREVSESEIAVGTLASETYPEAVIAEILAGDQGVIPSGSDLIAYAKIDPNPDQSDEHFYVVESLPRKSVYGSVQDFRNVAMMVALISLAITIPLGIARGRQLISMLERLISGISSSSQQIFSTVSEQERIASQQAASVSETSTTMEELEASSRQSAEQAMAAVSAAKTALDRAEIGTQTVDESLSGMYVLEQKVDAIAQQIVNLSGQADEIGNISQLVSDFASQTNMLALNSSVEAVRAGEHGRGFAVVANEIRKLSDQSQQSADRINNLVAEIQKLINKTVMVTEEGTKTAKAGVKLAKLTEVAFDDIRQSIDAVVLNNQQVSLTQKQQVDAIRQVVTAMETIDRSSKESATGLTQTRTGTAQLNETAQSLRELM